MSRVVSFRLDDEVYEERQALAILEVWQARGYSIRQIMTWALMALEGLEPPGSQPRLDGRESQQTVAELRAVLGQAQEFLEALRDLRAVPPQVKVPSQPQPVLSEAFLAAVKKAVRPGLTLDE
jgi:hypothetical protein